MSRDPVLFEVLPGKHGRIGLITLNRPEALNALSHEMIVLMHQKLLIWENTADIKCVVVRAGEGRAFCAGGDLRLVYEKHKKKDPTLSQFFQDEYRLNHYIFHYPKPYLAFLDGITMGGGAGISLNGSHCIATERTLFAMPETGIGFFPDVGATYFLSRLPSGLGFYLGLSGARLSGEDCLEAKLLDFKIPSADLPQVLITLADTPFDAKSTDTATQVLQHFHRPTHPSRSPLMDHSSFIERHFTQSSVEEILRSLEDHAGTWQQETAALLRKKSPTSLKVALRQLHEGSKRDFNQCMQLEYRLMSHFIQSPDFYEGIRAVLIEKDQAPLWQPADLHHINQEDVEAFFLPPQGLPAQLLFI